MQWMVERTEEESAKEWNTRPSETAIIRAFVGRIMSKYDNDELPLAERLFIRGDDDLYHALIAELAAMEKSQKRSE